MNKIISDRILKFNNILENCTVSDGVLLAKKEVKELMKLYKPTTVRAYMTIYRKALKVDSSLIYNALKISKSAQKGIQKNYDKTISKGQKNLIIVKDIDKMIQLAIDLLDSDKYQYIASALCFLTGRRATEIMKTAKFTNSKNSKNVMYFEGQLKTKEIKKKYEIYVLGGAKNECKKALKKLRSMVDTKNLTNFQVSRKTETMINDAVNVFFSGFVGAKDIDKCSAHDLRAIYATYCADNFKEKHQATNSFLSQILGHEEDDVNTANSYRKYYLS